MIASGPSRQVEAALADKLQGHVGGIRPRPFVKWAGGKTSLLPILRACRPPKFRRYFEPFLGGGAHFFDLLPQTSVLSDSNEELINCYRLVRDAPLELAARLRLFRNEKEEYYEVRAQLPAELSDIERAARVIYLNRTCYNGLYRVNRKGQFNTPYGFYSQARMPREQGFQAASVALKAAELKARDYFELLDAEAGREDFVYLDPPYLPVGKFSDFKRYTMNFFSAEEHTRLASLFRRLHNRGCLLMLSNSYHKEIPRLYDKFHILKVSAPRFINCRGKGRGAISEVIVTNYDPTEGER